MIDLLPPTIKTHKHYASLNRRLVRLIQVALSLVILVVGIFGASWYFLDKATVTANSDLQAAKEKSAVYQSIEKDAKALADRLTSIEAVQNQQAHYTKLLQEVSNTLPAGVYIYSLQVNSANPPTMQITAYAQTSEAVAAFKRALEASPRFGAAALSGVDQDRDPYTGQPTNRINLQVGLKPGALQ
ncbi:PilN domain-containing protein [bacterium]|nr:PilN domain-containing protein [bacterium]